MLFKRLNLPVQFDNSQHMTFNLSKSELLMNPQNLHFVAFTCAINVQKIYSTSAGFANATYCFHHCAKRISILYCHPRRQTVHNQGKDKPPELILFFFP